VKDMNDHWTKEEFKIYLLLYCANADFTESKAEIDLIKLKGQHSNFDKIHAEFESDNDYQSIQKIQAAIAHQGYSANEIESLYDEIKELFLSDGKYDVLEQNLYLGLRHILK
jgi:hypothetical protein